VRTVVARPNHQDVGNVGEVLERFRNIVLWSLLEFSPVGSGHRHRGRYELDRHLFDGVIDEVANRYRGKIEVSPRRHEDKSGCYVLMTPDGRVYNTADHTEDGVYGTVGSVLRDHLSDLADRLNFQRHRHESLYVDVERKRRRNLTRLLASRSTWSDP
jgi:hypothetical protein